MDFSRQPKLLGFAGGCCGGDREALRLAIRGGLVEVKDLLGGRLVGLCGAVGGADFIFLRCCVELRVPVVVILPFGEEAFCGDFTDEDERGLAGHLMGVALARYVVPGGKGGQAADGVVPRILLEWADAFLFGWGGEPERGGGGAGEALYEAECLGIPALVVEAGGAGGCWRVEADVSREARHGFETRKELLEFFDARFA